MEGGIHVAIRAEELTRFMGVPVTNTLIMSWIVVFLIALVAFATKRSVRLVPGKFQVLMETMIGGAHDFVASSLESKALAKRFTPLLLTFFLFILLGNWLEFVPGVESIVFHNHEGEAVPLLRAINTDLNIPLALAIIAFVTIEATGFVVVGFWKYLHKFFNLSQYGVGLFVGILELMSEMIRLISFSFRLFGNIFAGSVLVMIITFLAPYAVPAPFMLFEVFVGLIQAAVFALLTLFFIKLAIMDTGH
jgi:F-type H+-transporting ATPase subunit a